jgi:osmotically-inducible protein OsmY
MRSILSGSIAVAATLAAAVATAAGETYQLDPFAQATAGFPGCPPIPPPLVSADEMRAQAHVRSERGLRCAMEGTCEPGGAYKRDPEINQRIAAAIAADPRFARTSIWLTTSRKWVTLQGCVRSGRERRALVEFVRAQPSVERVFDETTVGGPKRGRTS